MFKPESHCGLYRQSYDQESQASVRRWMPSSRSNIPIVEFWVWITRTNNLIMTDHENGGVINAIPYTRISISDAVPIIRIVTIVISSGTYM
jgi:hypothetical protein